ncbi:helix-turn-helix transcriptional regulator [Psychrobacillus sp. MER TA 171]|nr:helix-turn-helix transcriptional regulator [Psychrobacillus sp. MER TA 171]
MSKFYYHRLFSAIMGCSLNQYILLRRLNSAVKLIQEDRLSLTEIAYQLNFGSQSSFTRAFKRQFQLAPSSLKEKDTDISLEPIPSVVKRPVKNINGDVVTDFTLMEFDAIRLTGIAFEVDLACEDYKAQIHAHSKMLLETIDETISGPCFMVYSNCRSNSTRFNALFGIPYDIQIDKPFYFNIDVPQIFCAKFQYSGDLLDVGDVFKTDFARFLKISKQEREQSDIELIQAFNSVHQLDSDYHIFTPIKKLPIDY